MGEFFALLTSCCFGGSNVSIRRGMQQHAAPDNGIFTVNFTNALLFSGLAFFLWLRGALLPLNWLAVGLFAVAGVLTVFAGRYFHYAAIRFIGPSRATAIRVSSPVVTGFLAFLFLGEKLTLPQYAGAGAVMAGVMLLIQETNRRSIHVSGSPAPPVGSLSLVDVTYMRASLLGSLSAIASASAYGSGHFMRKLALTVVPSPWWGMAIGSTVGWLCVLVLAWWQGNLKSCFRSNLSLTSLPRFFVLAGCLNGLGQMFSFLAISFITVSLASVIFAVEPLVTAVFSRLVMGREEPLGWRMLCGCFVTISGLLFVILL